MPSNAFLSYILKKVQEKIKTTKKEFSGISQNFEFYGQLLSRHVITVTSSNFNLLFHLFSSSMIVRTRNSLCKFGSTGKEQDLWLALICAGANIIYAH